MAVKWMGIAACICLAAGISFAAKTMILPKIDTDMHFSTDMGDGCYVAEDASSLITNPPGASAEAFEVKTMPVYEYKEPADKFGLRTFSEEEIEEGEACLREAASQLGWDVIDIEKDEMWPSAGSHVVSLTAKCRQGEMELESLSNSLYVQDNASMEESDENDPLDLDGEGLEYVPKQGQDMEDFVAETMESLQGVTGFSETEAYACKSYDYDGIESCSYYGYDGAGNLRERIANCALSGMDCYTEPGGIIVSFRLHNERWRCRKLGDYPIIDKAQAEEMLHQGRYITQYMGELPADAEAASCELTYVPEMAGEALLPYYGFLVEVEGEDADAVQGLKTFAKFYVPAVQEKYFKEPFEWRISTD